MALAAMPNVATAPTMLPNASTNVQMPCSVPSAPSTVVPQATVNTTDHNVASTPAASVEEEAGKEIDSFIDAVNSELDDLAITCEEKPTVPDPNQETPLQMATRRLVEDFCSSF